MFKVIDGPEALMKLHQSFNTYMWLSTNDSSTSLNDYMTENIICKIKIYMYFLNKTNENLYL